MIKALVSVAGVDRTGIIAAVATTLSEININILEISQTIIDGFFTMMMVVDIENTTLDFVQISKELSDIGETLSMSIRIQRMELFDAMHRI